MTSPYIYKLNRKIDLHELICMPFWIDNGDDQEVINILEDWLSDPGLKVYFNNEGTSYTISPDLDQIEIEVASNYISLSAFIGIMVDDGDILDSDFGKFIIKGDTIVKFTYIGNELD